VTLVTTLLEPICIQRRRWRNSMVSVARETICGTSKQTMGRDVLCTVSVWLAS